MKISVFNTNAPKLIAKYNGVLDKLLNGDTKDININSLRTELNQVTKATATVGNHLNSITIAQLKALRSNAKAANSYGEAVDHHASLNNLIPVLMNMVNELVPEEEEVSIDDILDDSEEVEDTNSDEEVTEPEEDEDEDLDTMLNFGQNGGPEDVSVDAEDASQEADNVAALPEGDDETNSFENLLNFTGVSRPKVSKTKQNSTNSNGNIVPDDFLK